MFELGFVKARKHVFAEARKQFDLNEDNNEHSKNVVLIALRCGSKIDHDEAKSILRKHMAQGYLTVDLNARRSSLWDKLKKTPNYKKIFPEYKA